MGQVRFAGALVFQQLDAGHLHRDIRLDAFRLNRTAVRRVVARGGQLQGVVAADRQHRLHRALAEGAGAHHHGAALVLQGAGDDFRRRGGAAVDQHHQGQAFDLIARVGFVVVAALALAALGVDDQPGVEEQVADFHRAAEHAARVVAQVEDQPAQLAFGFQFVEGFLGFVAGVVLELGHAQVAVAGLQHFAFHAFHFDAVTLERHRARLFLAVAEHRKGHFRTRFAAHQLHRFRQAQAFDEGVVDLEDQVAGLDVGAAGGGVVDRRDHFDEAVFHGHFQTQAAELAAGGGLQVLELVRGQVGGVRVQLHQHAADRRLDQLFLVHVLHIGAAHPLQHFREGAQLGDRHAVLAGLLIDFRVGGQGRGGDGYGEEQGGAQSGAAEQGVRRFQHVIPQTKGIIGH